MSLSRRDLLALGLMSSVTLHVPFLSGRARASSRDDPRPLLIVGFLRGGWDSLDVVVPVLDPQIASLRTLPSRGLLELDASYSLRPEMAPLHALFRAGEVAVVVATGLPTCTRSHFDAQFVVERGGSAPQSAPESGWLDRVLCASAPTGELPAVGVGRVLPEALRGTGGAVALDEQLLRDAPAATRLAGLLEAYQTSPSLVGARGRRALAQLVRVAELGRSRPRRRSAQWPGGRMADTLQLAAHLVSAIPELALVALDLEGWDTHRDQERTLRINTAKLATSLDLFFSTVGRRAEQIVLVLVSEFGRTVQRNGTGGTDHGWASAAIVMGPRVSGGVYGQWPGLAPDELNESRDLRATTDYRAVLDDVARTHFSLANDTVLFPSWVPTASLGLVSRAAPASAP